MEVERLAKETAWLLGNPSLVLLTKYKDDEPSFDMSSIPMRGIGQLCITNEPTGGGTGGKAAVRATRGLQYSPVLTRLSLSNVMMTLSRRWRKQ